MLGCRLSADESETRKVTNAEWLVFFAKEAKYMDEASFLVCFCIYSLGSICWIDPIMSCPDVYSSGYYSYSIQSLRYTTGLTVSRFSLCNT